MFYMIYPGGTCTVQVAPVHEQVFLRMTKVIILIMCNNNLFKQTLKIK